MKKLLLFSILLGTLNLFSQFESNKLRIFTFSEVEKLQQKNPKSIVVFTYTDWCKICHGMEKTTLHNETVIELLNENFYFIKLNGEEKKDIMWFEKKFRYKPSGAYTGMHEIAKEVAAINGKISYPTTTILNSKLEIDVQIGSYINSKNMQTILKKYVAVNNEHSY